MSFLMRATGELRKQRRPGPPLYAPHRRLLTPKQPPYPPPIHLLVARDNYLGGARKERTDDVRTVTPIISHRSEKTQRRLCDTPVSVEPGSTVPLRCYNERKRHNDGIQQHQVTEKYRCVYKADKLTRLGKGSSSSDDRFGGASECDDAMNCKPYGEQGEERNLMTSSSKSTR